MLAANDQRREVDTVQRKLALHPRAAWVRPAIGEIYGVLTIPRLHLIAPIIEGTDYDELARGVGHYHETPQPDSIGNVGLAGHRTTHGRPFWGLDELREGDTIQIRTAAGAFDYIVDGKSTVAPTNVAVLRSTPGRRELTLTTCDPPFLDIHRLVIHAEAVT